METENHSVKIMQVESNLDRARRRYPPGTSYVVLDGSGCDVGGEISKSERKHLEYPDYSIDCGIGFVYADGKWAPRIFDIPEHGAVEIHGDIYDDVLYMLQQTPRRLTDGKHSSKYYKYLAWNDISCWHCTHTSKPIIDSPFAPSFSLFHNPDGLTQEQVGEGYRLFYPSEIHLRDGLYESINAWSGSVWNTSEFEGYSKNNTYRVPAWFPKDFSEEFLKCYEAEASEPTKEELPECGWISTSHPDREDIVNLLKTSRMYKAQRGYKYLLWNNIDYWLIDNKPFGEEYKVNKLSNPINNSENEKHTENRSDRSDNAKSAILQSIDFKIGQGSASRGVGLKGSVSEIRLGNHSGNYQERLGHS